MISESKLERSGEKPKEITFFLPKKFHRAQDDVMLVNDCQRPLSALRDAIMMGDY